MSDHTTDAISIQRDKIAADLLEFTKLCREQAQELREAYAWHDSFICDLATLLGCEKKPSVILDIIRSTRSAP